MVKRRFQVDEPGAAGHAGQVYRAPQMIRAMLSMTSALLATLSPGQHSRALFPMDDPRRLDWDFVPKPDRNGLPLGEMDGYQRILAHSLLAAALSTHGYTQALQIMSMENILREIGRPNSGLGIGTFRNADRFYFSFYGRPALEDTWAWRVLGHHLSLSYTIIGQEYVSVTPCNMGSQPAEVGVMAPLRREEGLGFDLLHSMTAEQRNIAVIHHRAPADFATRQVPLVGEMELPDYYDLGILDYRLSEDDRQALKFSRDEPAGIAGAQLDAAQAATLLEVTGCYLNRMPAELAGNQMGRLEKHGLENLYFSWAGGDRRGTSHYYRIQGPDLLIEFDNAIDDGNHIHSVWRDLNNDLGHELLLDHYEREQATGHHLASRLTSTVPYRGRATGDRTTGDRTT